MDLFRKSRMTLKCTAGLIFLLSLSIAVPAQADLNSDLILAAGRGETNTVRELLDKGADVNSKDDYGLTALMFAARYGHTATVRLLCSRGADVNAKSKLLGYTALMNAAAFGDAEMVRELLGRGADVNARNDQGVTALTFATGRTEIVELLEQRGARQ